MTQKNLITVSTLKLYKENTILILQNISHFKKQFMFNVFKDDNSNKMVFEDAVNDSKIASNKGKPNTRRSLYGQSIIRFDIEEEVEKAKQSQDQIRSDSQINFNSPIFKILNLHIEAEAVNNFDSKAFEDLINSREKQEEEIKYE